MYVLQSKHKGEVASCAMLWLCDGATFENLNTSSYHVLGNRGKSCSEMLPFLDVETIIFK